MKKIFLTLVSSCLIAIICGSPVFAQSHIFTSTGKSFDKSWELTSGNWNYLIKYECNTDYIDENYTHTYHSSRRHLTTVTNSNCSFSDEDKGGRWAGIRIGAVV